MQVSKFRRSRGAGGGCYEGVTRIGAAYEFVQFFAQIPDPLDWQIVFWG